MPTIYISGQVTSLELHEAQRNFESAEGLLSAVGLDPVNPMKNGLPEDACWHEHMIKDIELLFPCDGILMLSNWHNSRGARIEHNIAIQTGKIIMYESVINQELMKIQRIKEAIIQVIGMPIEDCINPDAYRFTNMYYARLIFAYQCQKKSCQDINQLAEFLKRSKDNIRKYMKKYNTEFQYNKHFRELAERVDNLINNNVSL